MGQPKHLIVLRDGRTMIDHVIAALSAVCARIVVVGSHSPGHARGYLHIRDLRPGLGPLGGIEALLNSNVESQYLICPCDVPLITADSLQVLLTPTSALATIVRLANRDEPESLPARISAAALPTVRTMLDCGERAVWALMRALPADIVQIPATWERHFRNVNTPQDVEDHLAI
jgi:molybdopterin-guanine dinucleotide biosynthesis protein A